MSNPSKRQPMDDSRRCRSRISDGSRRCKKAAIRGGTVCASHGGSAPQVKKSARDRLLAAADPAVSLLLRAIEEADRRNILFHPSVLRAVQLILDRSGLGPVSRIELQEIERATKALSEAQAQQVAGAVTGILSELVGRGLLQPASREIAGVVREHLTALAGGNAPAPRQLPPAPPAEPAPEPEVMEL